MIIPEVPLTQRSNFQGQEHPLGAPQITGKVHAHPLGPLPRTWRTIGLIQEVHTSTVNKRICPIAVEYTTEGAIPTGRTVVKAAVLVTTQVEAVDLGHLAALPVVQGVPIPAEVGHEVPVAVAAVAEVHQLRGHQ